MKLEALTPTKRQQLSLLDAGPRDSGDRGVTQSWQGAHTTTCTPWAGPALRPCLLAPVVKLVNYQRSSYVRKTFKIKDFFCSHANKCLVRMNAQLRGSVAFPHQMQDAKNSFLY